MKNTLFYLITTSMFFISKQLSKKWGENLLLIGGSVSSRVAEKRNYCTKYIILFFVCIVQ